MKTAYFDCNFGAAGDMLLGAFLDSGLALSVITDGLALLDLPEGDYALECKKVKRCSIVSSHFMVRLKEHHHHDHHHHHHHDHDHDHDHRSLTEITRLIESSRLPAAVKALALRVFRNLGEAESKVHGVPVDEIHFHEVGAVDAIVDIVGFAIAYHASGIERAVVSPLPLGSGTVKTMHGLFPIPGPATVNLLQQAEAPVRAFEVGYECLTPTGAAILTTIADAWGGPPAFASLAGSGYGAGTLDSQGHPNVVRLLMGESTAGGCNAEIIACIECNIDDSTPQVLAYLCEKLMQEGALDVSLKPCTMKKGRQGHELLVLARVDERDRLAELIMKESTTIGVRTYHCERLTLDRDYVEVTIYDEKVRVKVARDKSGRVLNLQPEYDDCALIADRQALPLKEILRRTLEMASELSPQ